MQGLMTPDETLRRQGAGFSVEIETLHQLTSYSVWLARRQGAGFSVEIETKNWRLCIMAANRSPGGWLLG